MKLIFALLLICTFTSISAQQTAPKKTEALVPKTTQTVKPETPPVPVYTPQQQAIINKASEIKQKMMEVQKKLEGLDEFQLYQAYEIQLNQLQQAYDAVTPKT